MWIYLLPVLWPVLCIGALVYLAVSLADVRRQLARIATALEQPEDPTP